MATINDKIKKKALIWVQTVNDEFDNLSSRLKDKWIDWYKMYRVFENQEKLPGQSNIFIPKIFEIIEKKGPAVVANDPKFLVRPRTNTANSYIGSIRDTLGFWWDEDNMRGKLELWIKESLIYGVGLAKVDWYQETRWEKRTEVKVDEKTLEVTEVPIEEEVLIFERPTLNLRSIFDIKVDPRVESFQDGVGIIDIIKDLRWADLIENEDYDFSDLKGIEPKQLTDDRYADEHDREMDEDKGVNALIGEIDENRITIAEFWGLFSKTEDAKDEKEYIITTVMVDGKPTYVIRVEENRLDFRPFVKIDDRKMRGEFYSIGEVEPLEGVQIEYNNLRNSRIDFNNSINYPEWIYNKNANINPAHLIHRPNNIIPVDLPLGSDIRSVLRPVDKPVQPVSGYNEEAQMNRDFQTISQTIDFTDRGGSQGFTNTATGIKSRDIQVGLQAGNIIKHLEDAISEVGKMWLVLAEKFAEDELMIRRKREEIDMEMSNISLEEIPEKFTKIDKSVLKEAIYNYTVRVEAGSTTSYTTQGRAQDAVNVANTAAQFAALGVRINLEKVFKDILRDSFFKSNPEEYIMAPQPQQMLSPGMEGQQGEGTPTGGGGKVPLQPSQPTESMQPLR